VGAAEWKFPCPENEIAHYTACHIREPIQIDGRLDESVWQRASFSPRFTDMLTGGRTLHDTRACVLWDDENLYVAYRIEYSHIPECFAYIRFTTNDVSAVK
jgi:hypothetical protein